VLAAIENAPTTDNQFSAMVSLAYNIGVGAFARSTVARKHNEGDHQAAAEAFALWNKAGGRVLAGLVRRRKEEADLYSADI
jgi:lysozyme